MTKSTDLAAFRQARRKISPREFDRHRRRLAAADAQRGDAALDAARLSAASSVTRMRAPEAPIGWPSAQAPPLTLTLSCGQAELAHRRHRHHREGLVDLEQVDVARAPAGLVEQPADRADRRGGESFGSAAWVAWPTMRASGAMPAPLGRRVARVSTSAAAPSEIELELAAVTVPPSRNAGFSVGILSGRPSAAARRRRRSSRSCPP